jgi:hypothetical protein
VYLTRNLFRSVIYDADLNAQKRRLNKADELSLRFYLFFPQERYSVLKDG